MAEEKKTARMTVETLYRRFEEILLANSGENEFEEIFKMILLKLWSDFHDSAMADTLEQGNQRLVQINRQWPGVLPETTFRITQEQFSVCLDLLRTWNFSRDGYEEIDGVLEYLISREKKGAKGQFFTPRYLVDFCVAALAPQAGESILDPAAGSGAFLYHAYLHGKGNGSDLWGFDFDPIAVRTARLLMYAGGVDGAHIHCVNSLLQRTVTDGPMQTPESGAATIEDILRMEKKRDRFDLILTNPPFAGEIVEPELLKHYIVSREKKRVERDVLFAERCVELLKPGGRMAIILPDNVFGGRENEPLRRWIYEQCRIVGVVGIPRNLFMPHTPVKTSVMFLQKRTGKRTASEEIFFGISEQPGKDSRGNLQYRAGMETSWRNVNHDLDSILNAFRDFRKDQKLEW